MIYLDNAATTFPKPPCVLEEMKKCIKEYCGNPGRSGHFMSIKAAEKIYECRETLASFFGSDKPENIVFTLNTTYALNLAINTLYEPSSHVLISNMEHNSVLRPIALLEKEGRCSFSTFNVYQSTENTISELERRKTNNTKMLVMTHASNICGKIFPIKEIGAFCKKHDIIFIVDAAQSAGIADINIKECHIDALCAPAHKGLYGPQGLGFVIFGNIMPKRNFIVGGNGINSLSFETGLGLPESFECGTMPTPQIAGLNASVKWIKNIGVDTISKHEIKLANMLFERLYTIKNSLIYGCNSLESGIILYKNKKITVDHLSTFLNSRNICTRSGFHCSALAHGTLGTGDDGALRISFGFFNTKRDVDGVFKAIKECVQ